MIKREIVLVVILLGVGIILNAQQKVIVPDLSKIKEPHLWNLYNRELITDTVVHLNEKSGDGMLWLRNIDFADGRIEIDIKGKNEAGRSFVGLAFHILNDSTYDAIYFRPFNFKDRERSNHSIQYISHPGYPWYKLREENPGKYENTVRPIPDPEDWFHATIIVAYPLVKAFVNDSELPSLTIHQLSSRKSGKIGFWVGNNSDGYFNNLKVISN